MISSIRTRTRGATGPAEQKPGIAAAVDVGDDIDSPLIRRRNVTKSFQIAVYPGDGIGPEVIDQALRVLDAVQQANGGFMLEYTTIPWGIEYWKQHGCVAPEDFLDVLRPFDAILLGAVGWPELQPDHVTLAPLVTIRQEHSFLVE